MGVVSTVVFAARNTDKCVKGDSARGAVAVCQSASAIDSASSAASSVFSGAANAMSHADGFVESLFNRMGQSTALDKMVSNTGANSKIGAVAQSAVNPLLCVAAGVRVLKDEDQYAALIEETAAMGAMFGMESVMKYARSAVTGSTQANCGLAGKVRKLMDSSSSIKGIAEKASNWYKGLGATANGSAKQTLVRVGIDLLFVAGSILTYNAGKKLGELLSGRSGKKES